MSIKITHIATQDRQAWEQLYRAYAEFYNMPMNDEILDTVWSWIFDENNMFFAFIAKDTEDNALAIAHCREMPSPLRGTMVGFLDDLFITPNARGTQCSHKMMRHLNNFGSSRGWPSIKWITADNNYRARTLYDKVATKTHWVTYQLDINTPD